MARGRRVGVLLRWLLLKAVLWGGQLIGVGAVYILGIHVGAPILIVPGLFIFGVLPLAFVVYLRRDVMTAVQRLHALDYHRADASAERFLARIDGRPDLHLVANLGAPFGETDMRALALRALGAAETGLGQFEQAEIHLEASLAAMPDNPFVHHAIGLLRLQVGQRRDAEPWFQTASDLGYPASVELQMLMARLLRFKLEDGEWIERAPAPHANVRIEGDVGVDLLNDDKTAMEFVVYVLEAHFGLTHIDAIRVMLAVHHNGRARAGQFQRETAEALAERVTASARKEGFPLQLELVTVPAA